MLSQPYPLLSRLNVLLLQAPGCVIDMLVNQTVHSNLSGSARSQGRNKQESVNAPVLVDSRQTKGGKKKKKKSPMNELLISSGSVHSSDLVVYSKRFVCSFIHSLHVLDFPYRRFMRVHVASFDTVLLGVKACRCFQRIVPRRVCLLQKCNLI